jgi:hypothetical protein
MTFALLVHPQIPEAFRPVGFERVPNKSKIVELLSPSLGQSFFVLAPIIRPLAETKAGFLMPLWNAAVTLTLLVHRQIAEAFRPVGFERVPNKSKLVQLLPPSLRQSFLVFALALPKDPLPEAKAIFFMSGRNTTMTFALLVHPQIPEAFRPVGFERVPLETDVV